MVNCNNVNGLINVFWHFKTFAVLLYFVLWTQQNSWWYFVLNIYNDKLNISKFFIPNHSKFSPPPATTLSAPRGVVASIIINENIPSCLEAISIKIEVGQTSTVTRPIPYICMFIIKSRGWFSKNCLSSTEILPLIMK